MIPELRRSVIERASVLRGQLDAAAGAGGLDAAAAAQQAHRLFGADETQRYE